MWRPLFACLVIYLVNKIYWGGVSTVPDSGVILHAWKLILIAMVVLLAFPQRLDITWVRFVCSAIICMSLGAVAIPHLADGFSFNGSGAVVLVGLTHFFLFLIFTMIFIMSLNEAGKKLI